MPQHIQQILQQLQQEFVQQVQNMMSEQIRKQSTIIGVDIRAEHIIWKEVSNSTLTT
jgi:hypothetical protein